jgi:hypothetical protein
VTFRVGDSNKAFRYATNGFDMSAYTGLTLNFTKPDNTALQKTEASANPVDAPAVALVNDPDIGNQSASTYMEFYSVASDFDIGGTWSVCGVYYNTSTSPPTIFNGSPVEFEVLEACS